MKKIIVVLVCCLMLGSGLRAAEQELPVSSPSGRLELVVKVDQGIGWTLYYEKEVVSSSLGMALHLEEYGVLGAQPRLKTIHLQNHRDLDRKSTRLNSSHVRISYAVFCLKK